MVKVSFFYLNRKYVCLGYELWSFEYSIVKLI